VVGCDPGELGPGEVPPLDGLELPEIGVVDPLGLGLPLGLVLGEGLRLGLGLLVGVTVGKVWNNGGISPC
jgi:hypothetical protein